MITSTGIRTITVTRMDMIMATATRMMVTTIMMERRRCASF